jgi:hypothetical protein
MIERAGFGDSAANLAACLAVRRRDLRTIQRNLMPLGLSSMGRLESRVMPTLLAVKSALAALLNRQPAPGPSAKEFLAGQRKLAAETRAIQGRSAAAAPARGGGGHGPGPEGVHGFGRSEDPHRRHPAAGPRQEDSPR